MAAEMLGIGRTKLYELIADGEVDVVKLGRVTLITKRSIDALIERHQSRKSTELSAKRRRGRPRISFVGLRG
jgi:excisionase family DNA binding protein